MSVHDDQDDVLLRVQREESTQTQTLLTFHQKFQKTMTNMIRAKSHRVFLTDCEANGLTPKGLKPTVKCHALLKELTTVEQEFTDSSLQAEHGYVSTLSRHCTIISNSLQREVDTIQQSMTAAMALASPAGGG